MQNNQGVIDLGNQPKVSQLDKLLFCCFLAVAFHLILLFGLGFKLPELSANKYEKTFNVVLAQFEAEKKPEKADFIGQANQEGGGESEQLIAPSSTQKALFNDPDKISSELQQKQRSANNQLTPEYIHSKGQKYAQNPPEKITDSSKTSSDTASLIDKNYQLSGLIANLDNENVNQAKKGRKRAVSASIHRASDALYLDSWRRKIERVGNNNYPDKARLNNVFGNLTLKVSINKDGTINQVYILESSGHKILDDAALKIIRLSAPFKPLTKEMAKDTDILEIIRVWRFQPNHHLNTN